MIFAKFVYSGIVSLMAHLGELLSSSSAFALYIERFAYHCSFYFGPVIIPTSAILKKGSPQQVTHLPPVWDILLALA
jgi:hypothetical protein